MRHPNFTGLWQLNRAKSKLPGLAVSRLAMKIEHDEPRFIQAVKTLHEDGTVSLARFAGDTSGAEFSNPFRQLTIRSSAEWIGGELVIDSRVDTGGRSLHFRDHWSLSNDGNELRMEHRDDDVAGQLSVLERVSDGA